MLLAHGRAVWEMRHTAIQSLKIGMVVMGMVMEALWYKVTIGSIPASTSAFTSS